MEIPSVDALAGGVVRRFSDVELERICPFHQEAGHFPTRKTLNAIRPYEGLRGPRAMRVANESELLIHAGIALFVSSAHYELAMRGRWRGFPRAYCDRASTGVTLSLLDHGYANAVVLRADRPRDHSYVALPYALPGEVGVVIADPTFGQMPKSDTAVLVTRRRGFVWEYRPGWNEGVDLYPDMVLDKDRVRMLANMTRINEVPTTEFGPLHFWKLDDHKDPISYFRAAFSNLIDVPVPPMRGEILKKLAPW